MWYIYSTFSVSDFAKAAKNAAKRPHRKAGKLPLWLENLLILFLARDLWKIDEIAVEEGKQRSMYSIAAFVKVWQSRGKQKKRTDMESVRKRTGWKWQIFVRLLHPKLSPCTIARKHFYTRLNSPPKIVPEHQALFLWQRLESAGPNIRRIKPCKLQILDLTKHLRWFAY